MNLWWQFDGSDPDEDTPDIQLDAHERTALDAIRAIVALAEAQPDKALIVGASLRKLATVAQSNAQTVSLRSMTVPKRSMK